MTGRPTLSITISIPAILRTCCNGTTEVTVSAPNVRAMLDGLETQYPKLYRSVCDETGAVRKNLNLFVNNDHVRDRDGLDTALVHGDVVSIIPAVSGG